MPETSNAPIGVGIVGCGRMGSRHADAIVQSSAFRVAAVTDVNPPAAAAVAERLGAATATDVAELVSLPEVRVVAVCSPTADHATHVATALEAGLDVFCEKPLAPAGEAVRGLLDLARQRGLVVLTGYLYRYAPAFVRMRREIKSGALGEPHLAMFRIGGRGSHQAWKHHLETGGGAMFDMMSHMVDLAVWMFGPARDVRLLSHAILLPEREIAGTRHRVDAEDFVVAEWTAAGNVRCLVEGDLASPSFMQYAEAHGSDGSMFGSIIDALPTVAYLRGDGTAESVRIDEPRNSPIDEEWAAFADLIRTRDVDSLFAEAIATADILDALRAGARIDA